MIEEENQNKEKKVYGGMGIKVRIIAQMQNEGFEDINDYIDALIQRIKKLQTAREQIQNDLQQANQTIELLEAKLKECENANKNEV